MQQFDGNSSVTAFLWMNDPEKRPFHGIFNAKTTLKFRYAQMVLKVFNIRKLPVRLKSTNFTKIL